jgi:hypothetical protein
MGQPALMRPFSTLVIFVSLLCLTACSSKPESGSDELKELQRTKAGDLDVVLLAKTDALPAGKSQATLEFQRGSDRHLVDVGMVKAAAAMEMAGLGPMLGSVFVNKGDPPGRYILNADLGMTGTWKLTVQWDGPAGMGSATFPGTVK